MHNTEPGKEPATFIKLQYAAERLPTVDGKDQNATNHLADHHDPVQRFVYRDRHLCPEQKKAHVVLVRNGCR